MMNLETEHFKELLQHLLEVNEEGYEKLQSECLESGPRIKPRIS